MVIEFSPLKNIEISGNVECFLNGKLIENKHNTATIYAMERIKYILTGSDSRDWVMKVVIKDTLGDPVGTVNTFSGKTYVLSSDSTYSYAIGTFSFSWSPTFSADVKTLEACGASSDDRLFVWEAGNAISVPANWTLSVNWTISLRFNKTSAEWLDTILVEGLLDDKTAPISQMRVWNGDTFIMSESCATTGSVASLSPYTCSVTCVSTFSTGTWSACTHINLYSDSVGKNLFKFPASFAKGSNDVIQVTATFSTSI